MSDGTPIIIKKKKSHGDHGHHGGSWKVAYADFVTAMMAFFMVMWIMGLSDSTKAQVQGYFNDPMGFSKSEPMSKFIANPLKGMPPRASISQAPSTSAAKEKVQDEQELKKTEQELKDAMESDGTLKGLFKNVDTEITEDGLRIELVEAAGAVFFESGGIEVLPEARKLVLKMCPVIAKSGRKIIIEGHTDARKYSGQGYDNWDLSTDRAASVRRTLRDGGINMNQFVEVRGYADTKLRIPEDPYNFANRRVTILLPFHSETIDIKKDLPKEQLKHTMQAIFAKQIAGSSREPASE